MSDVMVAPTEDTADHNDVPTEPAPKRSRPPLYWWLLRLKHIKPNSWQRGVLAEGSIALALVLVLADVASAWTLLVLPVAVAVVVKAHDLFTGLLEAPRRPRHTPQPEQNDAELSDPEP